MTLLQKTRYEAIVKEAKTLFLEKGIDGVTMADLASHLSIGEATLYRYFGKKQKLMIYAAIMMWEEVYQNLIGRPVKASGYENLESFYGFFLEVFGEHPKFFRFVEEFDLKVIQGDVPKEELREYEEAILKFKKVFDQFFKMGQLDGTVKDTVDGDIFYYTTSHGLISLCKKLATQSHILEYENKIEEKVQIKCLIQICLQYISKRGSCI